MTMSRRELLTGAGGLAALKMAPELRFHPTTSTILSYLNPEIEVVRVGLAESWRRGLPVMRRH